MLSQLLKSLLSCGAVLWLLTLAVGEASAQSQSMFGSRAMSSRTSTGIRNSSSTTGSGRLQSQMGTSALSSMMSGGSAMSPAGGTFGTGFLGRGSGGFIGGNNLLGNNAFGSNLGSRTTRRRITTTNRNNNNRRNRNGTSRNRQTNVQTGFQRRAIRPRQRVAFTYSNPTGDALNTSLRTRFENLAVRRPAFGGLTLAVDDAGLVTIRGEVASEEAARLAVSVARMEPGVRDVRSELTVISSDSPN